MYLFDFFKNLFKKNNIGIIIWLFLNILFIVFVFSGAFSDWAGVPLGIGIYFVSLLIALSPIGEWILRLQTRCKKIKDQNILDRIEPLFKEVYAKAKALNPELPDNIKIFMSDDEDPNAFATGRKTLCITRGLLAYSDEHIKGVMAHEFGHLAHKDTDLILVVSVGNLIVTCLFVLIRIFANIFLGISQFFVSIFSEGIGGLVATLFVYLSRVISDIILLLLMRLWTQLGVWLCMHSSRKNEFRADEYAHDCGYNRPLREVLTSFGVAKSKNGLFASLSKSHPENSQRIQRLIELENN